MATFVGIKGCLYEKTDCLRGDCLLPFSHACRGAKCAADEVVELYVTHENAGDSAALFALKGFQRVSLAAGDSMRVKFVLTPE